MSKIKGACWCGACTVTAEGPAQFAIRCFCSDCQQVSGAGSLPQLAVERAGVATTGPVKVFRTEADSGNDLTFTFCDNCSSPLMKTSQAAPTLGFLAIGALQPGTDVPELREVFAQGRAPWDI